MLMVLVLPTSVVFCVFRPLLAGQDTILIHDPPFNVTMCQMSTSAAMVTIYPLVYSTFLFVSFVIVVVLLIIVYVRIWLEIRRHNRNMRQAMNNKPASAATYLELNKPAATTSLESPRFENHEESAGRVKGQLSSTFELPSLLAAVETANSTVSTETNDDRVPLSVQAGMENGTPKGLAASRAAKAAAQDKPAAAQDMPEAPAPTKHKSTIRTYRTTITAFLVTVVFFLSFVPFLVLEFLALPSRINDKVRGAQLAAYHFFYSFPFLNAVANPIIYGVLNPAFRVQCARVLKKMICRGGQNNNDESDSGPGTRTTSS
jgi:heme/copper-type cytochrome/quinol oxidase subunit 2